MWQTTMANKDTTRQMVELYRDGVSLENIGKKFGMTRQGVRERFIKAGIPRRGKFKYKDKEKDIDKARLEKLYLEDKMSLTKIAGVFSVNAAAVNRALKFHQIPKRRPINKGGYLADFLRSLEINEKGIIDWRRKEKYAHLHTSAKQVGIKIFIRGLGSRRFEVTRIN